MIEGALLEKNNLRDHAGLEGCYAGCHGLELVMPNVKDWQSGDGCHMTKLGTEEIGKQVAEAIRQALSKSKAK